MPDSSVLGVGMTPFVRRSDEAPGTLGSNALRAALADAGLDWQDVELLVVGAVGCGLSAAPSVLARFPRTGVNAVAVENASATGSSALAMANMAVASGQVGVAAAVGIGSLEQALFTAQGSNGPDLGDVTGAKIPPVVFALRAARRMYDFSETEEDHARVAVKNLANASSNEFAQRRKAKSLDQVLSSPMFAEPIRRDECCPLGDGSAAVVLGTGSDHGRSVGVLASVSGSDRWHPAGAFTPDPSATARCASIAYQRAGILPQDLDVVEVHDAFAVEELDYCEGLGLCAPGEAAASVADNHFDIGGRVAVSPSGGLIGRGHPGGATGLAQIVELVSQLRGDSGDRQQPGARLGLAHMIGAGGICTVHVLGT
jgi:acetyl-CoA acetyltransferase